MEIVLLVLALVAGVVLGLQALRLSDLRRVREAWSSLEDTAAAVPTRFDPAMVADLPDPARRYFLHAIDSGAPLGTVAEIEMTGELSLGTKAKPNYMPMEARQILAGECGFVWTLRVGSGLMRLSGSDGYVAGEGWTRFWLLKLIPVARVSGGRDVARSAAGRAIAESVFWTPAALLPRPGVVWEPVDADTARARVSHRGHVHVLDLTVASDGRPAAVLIQRWSRENPEREWRLQPFGGTVEAIMEVDGHRLAARVDGGNWFGTEDYFLFYRARVRDLRLRHGALEQRPPRVRSGGPAVFRGRR